MKLFRIKLNPKIHIGVPFWGLVFITSFLLFTRWLFNETFFLSSLYFVVTYLVLAYAYSPFALDGITIERKSRYSRRQVGDLYEEHLLITNHSILPIFWMQIRDRSDLSRNHANRVIGFLGSRQTRLIRMSSFLQKRGNIALTPIEIITSDPLGCFEATHTIDTDGSLIIQPYRVDLSAIHIKNRKSEEGRSTRLLLQHSDLISGSVRAYAEGDPFNRIHWPTTARKGSLHTKLPDETIQQIVWICMDCQRKVHNRRIVSAEQERLDFLDATKMQAKYSLPPDTMETTVSITSSLAVTWLKKGIAVGLVFNNHPFKPILPGLGIKQQIEVLNTLTYIQADSMIALPAILEPFSTQLRSGNICYVVTPDDSGEMVTSAQALTRKGIDLRVIHINRESFSSGFSGVAYNRDWSFIRTINFNYGDALKGIIPIL